LGVGVKDLLAQLVACAVLLRCTLLRFVQISVVCSAVPKPSAAPCHDAMSVSAWTAEATDGRASNYGVSAPPRQWSIAHVKPVFTHGM